MKQKTVLSYFDRFLDNTINDGFKHIYNVKEEYGYGELVIYCIAPGIELSLYDLDVRREDLPRGIAVSERMLSIDYCITGQYECMFNDKTHTLVSDGDVCISTMDKNPVSVSYHKNQYKRAGVHIDIDRAGDLIFGMLGQKINPEHLYKYFQQADRIIVMKKPQRFEAVFLSILSADTSCLREFYLIKVMELLILTQDLSQMKQDNVSRYFSGMHLKKAEKVRDYIHSHYEQRLTIDYLAGEFDIPPTSLRILYKARYNDTVYNYLRRVRVHNAKRLLMESDKKIVDIAYEVGYMNPSKFAAAFKDTTGITPLKYRNEYRSALR